MQKKLMFTGDFIVLPKIVLFYAYLLARILATPLELDDDGLLFTNSKKLTSLLFNFGFSEKKIHGF